MGIGKFAFERQPAFLGKKSLGGGGKVFERVKTRENFVKREEKGLNSYEKLF